jgi:hypothetical protein
MSRYKVTDHVLSDYREGSEIKLESGSQSRTRTCNLAINSRLLCQLSYLGMNPKA